MKLSDMAPRDMRAFVALVASIGGSIALTGLAAAVVLILWRGGWPVGTEAGRIELLGKAMLLALGGSLVVLISLGFAITQRSFKLSRTGIEASGGESSASVTTTTTIEAPAAPKEN
jgi:hypothetical protein